MRLIESLDPAAAQALQRALVAALHALDPDAARVGASDSDDDDDYEYDSGDGSDEGEGETRGSNATDGTGTESSRPEDREDRDESGGDLAPFVPLTLSPGGVVPSPPERRRRGKGRGKRTRLDTQTKTSPAFTSGGGVTERALAARRRRRAGRAALRQRRRRRRRHFCRGARAPRGSNPRPHSRSLRPGAGCHGPSRGSWPSTGSCRGTPGGDGTVPPARSRFSARCGSVANGADARDVRRAADGAARGFGRRPRRRRAHHPGGARRVRRNRDERLPERTRELRRERRGSLGPRAAAAAALPGLPPGARDRAGTRTAGPRGKIAGTRRRAPESSGAFVPVDRRYLEWACPSVDAAAARLARAAAAERAALAEAPNPPRRFSRRSFRRGGRAPARRRRLANDARRASFRKASHRLSPRPPRRRRARGLCFTMGSTTGLTMGSTMGLTMGSTMGLTMGSTMGSTPPATPNAGNAAAPRRVVASRVDAAKVMTDSRTARATRRAGVGESV